MPYLSNRANVLMSLKCLAAGLFASGLLTGCLGASRGQAVPANEESTVAASPVEDTQVSGSTSPNPGKVAIAITGLQDAVEGTATYDGEQESTTGIVTRRSGQLQVVYYPVRHSRLAKGLSDIYKRTGIFEKLGDVIDRRIRLPRNIRVELRECLTPNAFYDSRRGRIIMCYELTEYFIKLFRSTGRIPSKRAGELAMYATVFTFYHEAGHMLANELELPITGREEDAVDQFSTIVFGPGSKVGEKAAEAAALWFAIAGKQPAKRIQYMSEHSLNLQRFYAIVCLLYGGNPQKYTGLTSRLKMPPTRLQKCRSEYAKVSRNWKRLLAPHSKS